MKRRGSTSDVVDLTRLRSGGPHTDDSDVSSLRVDDQATTTDHDGDIEDYSDHDEESSSQHFAYFPPNQDNDG